jgi:hypothetical protein
MPQNDEVTEAGTRKRPFVHYRISTSSFRGENRDQAIRVPHDFHIREGAVLSPNCVIGKQLGAGLQVMLDVCSVKLPLWLRMHVPGMPNY